MVSIFYQRSELYFGLNHGLRTPGEEIALTALHGRKSTHTPKFLGMAEAYFVCHIGPNFQISMIYAFSGCPQSVF